MVTGLSGQLTVGSIKVTMKIIDFEFMIALKATMRCSFLHVMN